MITRGFAVASDTSPLAPFEFERRAPGSRDVQIAIDYCGICHSDIHTARNEPDDRHLVSVDITAPNGPRHVILGVTGEARVFHWEGIVQTQGAAYRTVTMPQEGVRSAAGTLIVRLTNTGRGTVAGIDNIRLRH